MPTAIRASSGSPWSPGWSEAGVSGSPARHDLLVAVSLLRFGEIVRGLQVQPEARIGAEVASQPNRGIRGNVTRAAHDLGQAVGRNTQFLRQGSRRQAERHQIFLPQHLSRMSPQPRHRCLLNYILNLYHIGAVRRPAETDAPLPV